jgi:peptide/nickel transport system permease protein
MRSLWAFLRRPANATGAILVLALLLVAALAPVLAPPVDPEQPSFKNVGDENDDVPHPPSPDSPLGTVSGQIDVYHTLLWGTRSALVFGLSVALAAACLGSLAGAAAAYAGGWLDALLMRTADALTSVPLVAAVWLFEVLLARVYLPTGVGFGIEEAPLTTFQRYALSFHVTPMLAGLALFMWMPYARLVHDRVYVLRQAEFVTAARALGMSSLGIVWRHLLPNALTPALVLLARDIGAAVVIGAAFTFVGLAGGPEWGALLVVSRSWILGVPGNPFAYWWVFLPVTAALALFSTAWNLVGDGLAVTLEPGPE